MGVIPKIYKEQNTAGGGEFLKASNFEGNGMTLEVKDFKVIRAKNADFGANSNDYLMTSGMLKEGETIRYTFRTMPDKDGFDGSDKTFDSKSVGFYISFSQLDPEKGDKIHIAKTGTGKNTRYDISKVNG
jgi:hypothetical protein